VVVFLYFLSIHLAEIAQFAPLKVDKILQSIAKEFNIDMTWFRSYASARAICSLGTGMSAWPKQRLSLLA
jgi:hypothetical protein